MTVTLPNPELAGDQSISGTQRRIVSGTPTSPATNVGATPTQPSSRGNQTSTTASACTHTQGPCAVVEPNLTDDQNTRDAHFEAVVGDPTCPDAMLPAKPTEQPRPGTPTSGEAIPVANSHTGFASPEPNPTRADHECRDAHTAILRPGGFLRDPVIGVLADVLDDLETVRIANANRVRILTRNEADIDGEERGFGLTEDHPEVAKLALTVKALGQAEHDAILNLQRAMRKHPLAPFQKRHKGLGEKQFARLLAAIGDPYWHDVEQRPRTVSELWAYTGFHVIRSSGSSHRSSGPQTRIAAAGSNSMPGASQATPPHIGIAPGVAPKRTRGQQSNWSETARKRVWVIASAMPKFPGGHYEQVYRQAREKYADATHGTDCVRCGPSGKPALAGTDLSDGHKHARAVRIVAKELLKDIWRESRDLYLTEQDS